MGAETNSISQSWECNCLPCFKTRLDSYCLLAAVKFYLLGCMSYKVPFILKIVLLDVANDTFSFFLCPVHSSHMYLTITLHRN